MCQQSFKQNFEDAAKVEWSKNKNQYEAISYKNEMEYIAIFDLSGTLMEYRQNLSTNHLPIAIKDTVVSMGEIMSFVLKNKGNSLEYEVIVRVKELNRYL